MHPDTFDLRKARGLLSNEAVAYEIKDLLVQNAEASKITDGYQLALINDEMREAIFGAQNGNGQLAYSDEVLDELNETVGELTRPQGIVYQLLKDEGMTLCTTRVQRKAKLSSGATIVVGKQGRFITADADTAYAFNTVPDFSRAEKAVERAFYKALSDAERIPALQAKIGTALNAARSALAQLNPPQPPKNGGSK